MIDRELLNRIRCIMETGSFAGAAEKLFVSRQALVTQVTSLEKQIGFNIFERTNRGVVLTAAGKVFVDSTTSLLKSYNDMLRSCSEKAKGVQAIRIGSLPNLPGTSLPKICNRYHQLYPQVKLYLLDYSLETYFDLFKVHTFDIMTENMMNYYHDLDDLCFLHIQTVPQHIGVIADSPLARKKKLKFSDLRGKSLMMYKEGIGKSEDLLRAYINKNEPDIKIIDITSYDSSLTTKAMLENALVFLYTTRSYPGLKSIPADWDLTIELGIGYRRNPSKEVTHMLELTERMNKEVNLIE